MEKKLSDQYVGVLTWVIQNTAVSPADCYVFMKSNERFVQFQKKQGITRKNLIRKLMAEGQDALFIRKEDIHQYIDFLERFLMTDYARKKIMQFIKEGRFHLLEFPAGIQISHGLKVKIKDSLPQGFTFTYIDSLLETNKVSVEDEERESRILEVLYDDIGLGSDAEGGQDDDAKHDEIIELMNQMANLREENDHLRDRLKEIDEKEKEIRKTYDELYSVEGDKNELQKITEGLQRKLKIAEAELEQYKDTGGFGDAKLKKENEKLEKRVEEFREEAKDFKIKLGREMEETKRLKRELQETSSRLNKTAMALKKVSNK
ncbi:MAG: hypothetical protein VX642_13180 [Bdellovibrionota bacterium]|nr:hypothetical protein [Bdellovibrionota bacterium]